MDYVKTSQIPLWKLCPLKQGIYAAFKFAVYDYEVEISSYLFTLTIVTKILSVNFQAFGNRNSKLKITGISWKLFQTDKLLMLMYPNISMKKNIEITV